MSRKENKEENKNENRTEDRNENRKENKNENKGIVTKPFPFFLESFLLLMVEVVGIIGLMILAKPLQQCLPLYFIAAVMLAILSWFLLRFAGKSDRIKKQILLANLAGMLWWTLAEIGRDVFGGANIENQGGSFLLMALIAALFNLSGEISLANTTAVLTFLANWAGHFVLEVIMYFRNPQDPTVAPDPHAFWNVFGFGYGIFSAVAAIAIVTYVIIKKPGRKAVMVYALVEYVMALNLLYIFAKGLFVI